jgi:hypothetical protein
MQINTPFERKDIRQYSQYLFGLVSSANGRLVVLLPERLTGSTYRQLLALLTIDILSDVLPDIPVQLRVGSWLMHDGAASLFTRTSRQYLNDYFPGNWIGRNGPVAWPARSPDHNHIDFYISGHVKNEVYSTHFTNFHELWESIVATNDVIMNSPGQVERVRDSMIRCLNGCVG